MLQRHASLSLSTSDYTRRWFSATPTSSPVTPAAPESTESLCCLSAPGPSEASLSCSNRRLFICSCARPMAGSAKCQTRIVRHGIETKETEGTLHSTYLGRCGPALRGGRQRRPSPPGHEETGVADSRFRLGCTGVFLLFLRCEEVAHGGGEYSVVGVCGIERSVTVSNVDGARVYMEDYKG